MQPENEFFYWLMTSEITWHSRAKGIPIANGAIT
jgi:hypothetical protein